MAQRKTLEQQIAQAQKEMQQRENRLKELLGKQKEQDRKARNHRLCKRMGIIEKYLPDTIPLTDEQFIAFVEEAVANDYGKRKLANIISQGADKYPPKSAEKTATEGNTAPDKPAGAKPNANGNTSAAGGDIATKAG